MEKSEILLSAALKLFVQYGFHGTPTSKIASEAGVSNGTLFHYFRTKDDLVIALYNDIKDKLNRYLLINQDEKDVMKRFKSLFFDAVHWSLANRDEYYFIQQVHFSPHMALVPIEELARQALLHTELYVEMESTDKLKALPIELIATMIGKQIDGLYQYLPTSKLTAKEQEKIIGQVFDLTLGMISK